MIRAAILLYTLSAVAQAAEPAHFHHVRLNVRDVRASMRFYERTFGAVPVTYRKNPRALFVERSLILFHQVDKPPDPAINTAIWHIGWGGVDVRNEFEWHRKRGADIHTPLRPLPGFDNFYFYLRGPDKELIEINTMGHHRFAHVHLFADDVNATSRWYATHLGLKPRFGDRPRPAGKMETLADIWMNFIPCDNVQIIVFGKPDVDPPPSWWPDRPLKKLEPTAGRPIDRLAFSYRELKPAFERMRAAGVKNVETPRADAEYGFQAFSVEGPDGVRIDIVEEKPIPEGIWD